MKITLVDLSKLSNVIKNDISKKTTYDELVKNVNTINTSGFALKTQYNTDNLGLEKTLTLLGLLKKIDYNDSITEIEGKISSNTALNAVGYKIPNVSDLVNIYIYIYNDAKTSDIVRSFPKSDCNKFMGKILNAKIKEKK